MREAIDYTDARAGRTLNAIYDDNARVGDHIWYISDTRKFRGHYPGWRQEYDIHRILDELIESAARRA